MRAPLSGADCVWYESIVIYDDRMSARDSDEVSRVHRAAPESFVAVADGPARVFLTPDLARRRIGPKSAAVVTMALHEHTPFFKRPGWDHGTHLAALRENEEILPGCTFNPDWYSIHSIYERIVRPDMEIFVIGKPSRQPGVGIVLRVPFRPVSGVSILSAADVHHYLASRATRSLLLISISFVAGFALIAIGALLTWIL
jgi:hypothetical protein